MPTRRAADHPPLSTNKRRGVQPAAKRGDGAGRRRGSQRACLSPHPIAQSRSRHVPLLATTANDDRYVVTSHPLCAAATSSGQHSPTLPPTPNASNGRQPVMRSTPCASDTTSKHGRHDKQAATIAAVTGAGAGRHRRRERWSQLPAGVQRANRRPCRRRMPSLTQTGATSPNRRHHPARPQRANCAAPSTRRRSRPPRQASGACCSLHHHAPPRQLAAAAHRHHKQQVPLPHQTGGHQDQHRNG